MENINININVNSANISGGLIGPESELENKLEVLFLSILDALRGAWDLTDSANVLLTLIFYKRILCLVEEGVIDFIKIEAEDHKVLKELSQQMNEDRGQAFAELRYALINIARQNPILENIFAPLVVALEHEEDLQHLVRVFWMMEELDFSTEQFPVATFGAFFNSSLNKAAARAGKSGGYWTIPKFLNELLAGLAAPKAGEMVYDPTAGQGSTLIELYNQCPELSFIAQEKDLNAWALCKMNLLMNGLYHANLTHENALVSTSTESTLADLAIACFPFGTTLDTRLVKTRPYISIPFEVTNTQEIDCNSLFVQLMLHRLKADGRMLVVLPLKTLFKDKEDRKLREYLLRRDWIEAVITLPNGVLYSTGVPVSIMVINKRKTIEKQDKVLFINASGFDAEHNSRMYKSLSDEDVQCILAVFRGNANYCGAWASEHSAWVSVDKILDNNANLNAKRYAAPFIRELERLSTIGNLLPLSKVFHRDNPAVWADKSDATLLHLPFVSKADVALSFADFQLQLDKLNRFKDSLETEGRLVNESVLIVNRTGARLRVSYFEYKGTALLVSKQLMIFTVDESKTLVEYLILQMHTPLFEQQFQMLKTDHEESFVSEGALLQLQVEVPALTQQEKIIRTTKLQLLQSEEQKVEDLRHRLNIGKQEARNRQAKIISSLHHELGNKLPAILTEFKNLRDYLKSKSEEQAAISMEEPIFPVFEEEEEMEGDLGADTLGKVVAQIENMLVYTISTIDAAGNIIDADKDRMNLEYCLIRELLESISQLYSKEKRFSIRIDIEEDDSGKELQIATILDKNQMTTAICNLIENAKRHGFIDHKKYLIHFKVGLSNDKKEVIIEYKNDGKPFPAAFSFEDFISYGNYAGETGHSGIGGYLIQQIMENHEGTLIYHDKVDRSDPFKVQFEIVLPHRRRTV